MLFFITLNYTPIHKIHDQSLQAFLNNLWLFAACGKRVVDLVMQIPFTFMLNLTFTLNLKVKVTVFEVQLYFQLNVWMIDLSLCQKTNELLRKVASK